MRMGWQNSESVMPMARFWTRLGGFYRTNPELGPAEEFLGSGVSKFGIRYPKTNVSPFWTRSEKIPDKIPNIPKMGFFGSEN